MTGSGVAAGRAIVEHPASATRSWSSPPTAGRSPASAAGSCPMPRVVDPEPELRPGMRRGSRRPVEVVGRPATRSSDLAGRRLTSRPTQSPSSMRDRRQRAAQRRPLGLGRAAPARPARRGRPSGARARRAITSIGLGVMAIAPSSGPAGRPPRSGESDRERRPRDRLGVGRRSAPAAIGELVQDPALGAEQRAARSPSSAGPRPCGTSPRHTPG